MKYAKIRRWMRRAEKRHVLAVQRKEDRKRWYANQRLILNAIRDTRD